MISIDKGFLQEFQLPQPIDDEFDEVSMSVNTDSIFKFAQWNPTSDTLSFYPSFEIEAKLYQAIVTLDDGDLTTSYTLSIIINESEEADTEIDDYTTEEPGSEN